MRTAALLLALAAILASPLVAPPPGAAADVGDFRGFVTHAETGSPVSGAVVSAGERIAVTGPDGAYRLPLPMAGRYVVRVESASYHAVERTAEMAGGRIDLNFELSPRRPEARVFGTVYDAALMRPVAKAEVALDGVALRTGPDGQFVFDPVEAGDRWLSAAAAGYKVSAKRLRIEARHLQADVYLTPNVEYASIEGVCLDRATSAPVPLAVVRLGDDRTATDADGRFSLPERVPGEARLTVTRDGYYKQDVALEAKSGRTNLVIRLEARDTAEILDRLRRNARERARIDAVTEGPSAAGARSLAVSSRTLPLAERRREIERILGGGRARPGDRFIRGNVRLAPDGEDAGFIAFLHDPASGRVRSVSLRAAANSRGVLLTRAAYDFRPTPDGLIVTLSVDGWRGSAPLRETGRFAEFDILLAPERASLAGPVDALALAAACAPAVPAKPGCGGAPRPPAPPARTPRRAPDPDPAEPPAAPPAPSPAPPGAGPASPPDPGAATASGGEPARAGLEVALGGWSVAPADTFAARGMALDLAGGTDAAARTAKAAAASLRLTDAERLTLGYARLDHAGALAAPVTFDGLAYAAGASVERRTELLDVGLSRRLLDDGRGSCRLDGGLLLSRSTLDLAQRLPAGLRAGRLEADFNLPYAGLAGRTRLSPAVSLEATARGATRPEGDGATRLADAGFAFLIGDAPGAPAAEPAWRGRLGYRYFLLRGERGGDSVDLKCSGPTFGLTGLL